MTDTNPRDLLIEHDELLAKLSVVLWNYGINNAARRVDAAAERLHNFLAQPELDEPADDELPPRIGHILKLAAIIREVDGNHSLGAAALAEAILSHRHSRWIPAIDPMSQAE